MKKKFTLAEAQERRQEVKDISQILIEENQQLYMPKILKPLEKSLQAQKDIMQ
jgi:hypothetical protein